MGLVLLIVVLINFSPVQNLIVKKATKILADKLDTKVSIKHIRLDLLNHIDIQGVYIEDKANDTLLYAGELEVRITDWFFLRKGTPVLSYLGLEDAYVHLYRNRKSDEWNYQFIADAFSSDKPKKEQPKKESDFEIDLKKIELDNIRFHMDDHWVGSDYDIDLGSFRLDANDIDFKKKLIDLERLQIKSAVIGIADYVGGKPPSPRKPRVIDTTAFNSSNWKIRAAKAALEECRFLLKVDDYPAPAGEFDATNMDVTHLNISAKNLNITGDTLTARLENLSLQERCGFVIKKLQADVTVSPNASICKNMRLVTNNSDLSDYYAMHYERFPDFTDYNTKVRMVASLKDAKVDVKDIAYFAPPLKDFEPANLTISGKFDGTVSRFETEDLNLSDGASMLKGNLAMTGLPEIDKTFIEYTRGDVITTGYSLMKYIPMLRNNPNIATESLSYVRFTGNFIGFIDRFVANGLLTTNLGNISSNISLSMQDRTAKDLGYKGTVSTEGFNLGRLLRQPELGMVSFVAKLEGRGLEATTAATHLDARVTKAYIHGYEYHNILAEGDLSKGKFEGNLSVDDPNLALAFYGEAILRQKTLTINATANLLQSDLKTLNITKDSVVAVADFDLNWTGSSIDSFDGYAKLYNINLIRNNDRVDIDSVYIVSGDKNGEETITLQSNDVSLYMHGNYQLSLLPYSIQQYLHGYLPNYIDEPTKLAPNQVIAFDIQTRKVDNLVKVLVPAIHGFDNTSIQGSINTNSRQLNLTANSPKGYIGAIRLDSLSVNGMGNNDRLEVTADVKKLSLQDSILNLSINANALLTHDSFLLKVLTESPNSYGTARLNVAGIARGDSLTLTMLPSEFYLVKNKWDIDSGNRIVLSDKNISINNFNLSSGIEKLAINTTIQGGTPKITADISNLDLAIISSLTGFSAYHMDGRINGTVDALHLLDDSMHIAPNLKISGVKIDRDTIGEVRLRGSYDNSQKVIKINRETGIFNQGAALYAEGQFGLSAKEDVSVDTRIRLLNAQLNWLSPVLTGLFSNLKGELSGIVDINGTTSRPNIEGNINLHGGRFKVDYTGVNYAIDKASISVDNNSISFDDATIYDRFKNTATLKGSVKHDHLKKFLFQLELSSDKIEAVDLKEGENENFYGNVIANIPALNIRGPIDDMRMSLRVTPAGESKLYIPVLTGTEYGSYSYVTFKTYGEEQKTVRKDESRFSINISAIATPDLTVSLILDPASGDQINATGSGNLTMDFSTSGDFSINGLYNIDHGNYYFTFRQLALRRNFIINSGSKISFGGNLDKTTLDVKGTYRLSTKLYDLLSNAEINTLPSYEIPDAKTAQNVDVLLFMRGSLDKPDLSFQLDLPEKRSMGTYAYTKLQRINQNERELFDQVASLLLIGSFYPPEGLVTTSALSGGINNMSQILSSTASSQLTGIVNRLLGNKNTQIEVNYKNYNFNNAAASSNSAFLNRNEFRFGIKQTFFNERVVIEATSTYDWGRPVNQSGTSTNFNPLGNLSLQYLITEDGKLRLNLFNNSSYNDVLIIQGTNYTNVRRSGVGLSWRKTFDNFSEFIHGDKYNNRKAQEKADKLLESDTTTTPH